MIRDYCDQCYNVVDKAQVLTVSKTKIRKFYLF